MQVLFGLEYAHAIPDIKVAVSDFEFSRSNGSTSRLDLHFGDVTCSVMDPSENSKTSNGNIELDDGFTANQGSGHQIGTRYSIGGLSWVLPEGHYIQEYLLYWVGADNAAFANVVLTFNACEIGKVLNLLFSERIFCLPLHPLLSTSQTSLFSKFENSL